MDRLQITHAGHSVKEQQAARRNEREALEWSFVMQQATLNTSGAILMAFKNVLGGGGQS